VTTLHLQVSASSDDARESGAGAVSITVTIMTMNSGNAWMGWRFLNVTIPQAAVINSATLQLFVDSTSTDDPDGDIYGNDVDSAATFTTASNDISGRALTTAKTTWTATGVGGGAFISAPSVTSVVQEIIDRGSWASGNNLALLYDALTGSGFSVRAYDNLASEAAKLDIDYAGAGQPMSARGAFVPGLRQWQPGRIGF
jgi:hypothetical protein